MRCKVRFHLRTRCNNHQVVGHIFVCTLLSQQKDLKSPDHFPELTYTDHLRYTYTCNNKYWCNNVAFHLK
ncbi:hypothetical protein [Klebsiella phage vB_KshKPC-M]|nr:hypothetical protein [Klebsiella phage vB_KshKPC-M]